MLKVGNYVTTYDENNVFVGKEEAEKINEEARKKIEKKFEQIIRKAKNYSFYFYQVIQAQMTDNSADDDTFFYGLYLSRMRIETDITMEAAAAVGFDLYTKVRVKADDPKLTPEEKQKAIQGQLYKTLNTEEYFLVFNPVKMALFSREERIAVIKHEIHHMLRLHHLRMFDDNFKIKSQDELRMENIVLDKEINYTFDNPGIRNLPGTKGHSPHVYPAVVKESYFVPAYKKGLITEKQLEEILSTDISAERMKEILVSITLKDPDFLNDIKKEMQQGQGQGKSSMNRGDGINGTDDIDDVPDDNLSPEEMKQRIKDLKKQIEEVDKLLKQGGNPGEQKEKNEAQKNPQNNQGGGSCNNPSQCDGSGEQNRGNGPGGQQSGKQNGQNQPNSAGNPSTQQSGAQGQKGADASQNGSAGGTQSPSGNGEQGQSGGDSDIEKEYNRLVNELAKKMAEAYMKGLLRGELDSHDQFVRNVPKGLEKEVAKKKALEKMEDMINGTRNEFDFERSKSRGHVPQEFQKALDKIDYLLKPQNNYKQLLRDRIKKAEGLKSGKKSTWDTRSIIEPFNPNIKGKKKMKKPPIALIIDVSGSMSDAEVLAAYGEIVGIIQEEVKNGGAALRVIQADTIVTMDELLLNPKKKDIVKIMKRTGNGGTYMEPAIKRALGIGSSMIRLPNGQTAEISNKKLLNKKSLGIRPRTIFVVTDGWIENEFSDIVPYGMPKDAEQSYLPPDVEIVWIVTGDFGNNPQMARKKAEQQLAFDYKQYGRQMKVIAIDKETILKQLEKNKQRSGPSI